MYTLDLYVCHVQSLRVGAGNGCAITGGWPSTFEAFLYVHLLRYVAHNLLHHVLCNQHCHFAYCVT